MQNIISFFSEKKMYELGLEDLSESQVVLTREIKFILLWDEFFPFFHQLHLQKIISKDGIFHFLRKN